MCHAQCFPSRHGAGKGFPEQRRMSSLDPHAATWVLAIVQIVGLASAWLARVGEASHRPAIFQRLFFVCLAVVGCATCGAIALGPGACVASGATFSIMVLGATCDFRHGARYKMANAE